MGRILCTVAITATLAALASGCGGSGSNKQQASYVAAGSTICSQALAQLHSVPEPTTPAQAISFLPRAISVIKRETGRLSVLGAPASERAQLTAALGSVKGLGTLLGRFLHQLRAGTVELSTFEQVQMQSSALRAQINSHFHQAGLTACVDKQV